MFAVVQDDQRLRALESSNQRIILGIPLLKFDLHRRGDAIENE